MARGGSGAAEVCVRANLLVTTPGGANAAVSGLGKVTLPRHQGLGTRGSVGAPELSVLFKDEVWAPYREREADPAEVRRMRTLSAHMQPMVVQALLTAFQRALREELRDAFPDEGPAA